MLTIALSKGRILEEILPLLTKMEIVPAEDLTKTRKLIINTSRADVRLVLVRASDVPTYVEQGAADFGVAGRDVLLEASHIKVHHFVDLQIARCRLCVAVPQSFDYSNAVRKGARIRIATKYVNLAREYFADKGVQVDVVKLYGSMELAPLTGLSDAIVDLVSSGKTLEANQLREVEEVMAVSSFLIGSPASFVLKRDEVRTFINEISRYVGS
jgi:ATP phosphoribosyltransferase